MIATSAGPPTTAPALTVPRSASSVVLGVVGMTVSVLRSA
jgi:hypothetical protein